MKTSLQYSPMAVAASRAETLEPMANPYADSAIFVAVSDDVIVDRASFAEPQIDRARSRNSESSATFSAN